MAFDLDKVIAEQPATPRKKQFEFTFDGNTYKLPNEIDMLAIRDSSDGDNLTALERLLRPEEFAQIRASRKMLTRLTLLELLNAYYEHLVGLQTGESAASSPSSKSTARPSKRTSARRTTSRSRK